MQQVEHIVLGLFVLCIIAGRQVDVKLLGDGLTGDDFPARLLRADTCTSHQLPIPVDVVAHRIGDFFQAAPLLLGQGLAVFVGQLLHFNHAHHLCLAIIFFRRCLGRRPQGCFINLKLVYCQALIELNRGGLGDIEPDKPGWGQVQIPLIDARRIPFHHIRVAPVDPVIAHLQAEICGVEGTFLHLPAQGPAAVQPHHPSAQQITALQIHLQPVRGLRGR